MRLSQYAVPVMAAAGVAIVLGLGPRVAAGDDWACSNRTLRGNYGFEINGYIFPPTGGPLLLRGVAMTTFDGEGNLTQVDHATFNGIPRWQGWRPAAGTYEINADCTGTAQIVPNDGTPALNLHLVVFDHGRQVRTVVDGNATGSLGVRVR